MGPLLTSLDDPRCIAVAHETRVPYNPAPWLDSSWPSPKRPSGRETVLMKQLSKRDMRVTRGGGTQPDANAAIQAQIAATWPSDIFTPPPGSLALFAELNGLSVKELQEIFNA